MMNPIRSAYRRANEGRKWLCPCQKRVPQDSNDLESRNLTVVLYSSNQFEVRGDFFMNHDAFEWLHKNVRSTWHAAMTDSFFYLGCRIAVAFYFEEEDDAMLFRMACDGGRLLSDYGPTIERERCLKSMRSEIDALSKSQRETRYPGLDDFLLNHYPVPAPARRW